MTTPITSSTPTAPAGGPSDSAAVEQEFRQMLGQNMLMRMQSNQQAMSKSMNKMTEALKSSIQDEE